MAYGTGKPGISTAIFGTGLVAGSFAKDLAKNMVVNSKTGQKIIKGIKSLGQKMIPQPDVAIA